MKGLFIEVTKNVHRRMFFCYHTSHLYYVRPVDGVASLAPFILPPYAEKSSEYCDFLLLPTAGIEPGPPAQQATAPFITQLPLGLERLLIVSDGKSNR